MTLRKSERIQQHVYPEDNKWTSMQVSVDNDVLSGNSLRFHDDFEEKTPKNYSDGQLNGKGDLIYDLYVIFEPKL